MTSKAHEESLKKRKIMIFFGLVIILTLAFAIKKLYFQSSSSDKRLNSLQMETNQSGPIILSC